MKLNHTFSRRLGSKKVQGLASALLVTGIVVFAATASATVTKQYNIEGASSLQTTFSGATDLLSGKGTTPSWDPAGGPYTPDAPAVTGNTMIVEFTDDGSGNIIAGPITIKLLDIYKDTNQLVPTLATITGQDDVTLTGGGVGTLDGSGAVPAAWTASTGEIHHELMCTDIAPGGCAGIGLGPSGVNTIVHISSPGGSMTIDTTATTAGPPASANMQFSADYSSVTFDITIATVPGRQYYDMVGVAVSANNVVPTLSEWGMMAFALLLLAAMFVAIRRRGALPVA